MHAQMQRNASLALQLLAHDGPLPTTESDECPAKYCLIYLP